MSTPDFESGALGTPAVPKLDSIFDVSDKFLNELVRWLEMHPPAIPAVQVLGFNQFTAKNDRFNTDETTTGTGYGNLATQRPTLTDLPKGKYLLIYGAEGFHSASGECFMAPSINGSTPADTDAAIIGGNGTTTAGDTAGVYGAVFDLDQDSNTILMKYHVGIAGTGHWHYRWLVALKIANL